MQRLQEQDDAAARIAAEWLDERGVLALIRAGEFDPAGAERLKGLLAALRLDPASPVISRALVSEIWFVPQFLEWNARGMPSAADAEAVQRLANDLWGIVDSILTLPERRAEG